MVTNIESFRAYCISKNGVTEEFPFDENTLVFKVMGKMFALTSVSSLEFVVNLKCDPEWSETLRLEHETVITPGYHMNKKHWNSVKFQENIDPKLLIKMIDHSYDLVVKGLKKADKQALSEM